MKANKARVLLILDNDRMTHPSFKDIPTTAEAGYGFDIPVQFHAFMARKGVPKDRIKIGNRKRRREWKKIPIQNLLKKLEMVEKEPAWETYSSAVIYQRVEKLGLPRFVSKSIEGAECFKIAPWNWQIAIIENFILYRLDDKNISPPFSITDVFLWIKSKYLIRKEFDTYIDPDILLGAQEEFPSFRIPYTSEFLNF